MNKEELIDILQKRSHDSLYSNDTQEPATEEEHEEYISKIKFRRKADKKVYPLVIIIASLVLVIIVLFFQIPSNGIKNDPNFILKSQITFKDLPYDVQDTYVFKQEIEKNMKQTLENQEQTIFTLKEDILAFEKTIASLTEKLEIGVMEESQRTIDVQQTRSKRYNASGCYIEKEGSHALYDSCKTKITKFLNANKNAKSFEIIAVTGPEDKAFLSTVLNGTKHSSTKKRLLEEYIKEGLARKRVLEAAWLIKNKLGKDTIITYVNYIAETANKKGFTVRAYN